uniref:Phospholipase A2 inhibitor 25 kDa subunit n=1 Tax=Naja kaouthia TaxID=8649 RepID=PLIGA_NAJKA|nr:RecName: Full=Phospholipase A2 inhibitor 25 kDa subunit; AltName: Full=gamma-PLI [Naja kaouthia]AAB32583.1 phospholipase A2 25 kda subunit, PLA2 25 kda subunit=urokinase-type plasminogen activator receptor homolog [Naja naja kaouthia=Thailand cobras, blood, Peptide, 185 aa] [Naja kaouthia]
MECEACIGMGKDCNSWMKTCAAHEDTCVTFQTEVIAAPVSLTVIFKACGVSDTCHLDYMETTLHDKVKVRIKRSCCTGEDCPLPPFPGLGFQVNRPNRLHCPACIGLFSKECTEHLVSCRASENQCLTVTGKEFGLFFRALSYKGCATESLCALLKKRFWDGLEDIEVDFKCTPALPPPSLASDV